MFRQWASPEATFQLLKACSEGMPCDITGIDDYRMIDEKRDIQWPLPEGQTVEPLSQRRLFEDGQFYTPDLSLSLHPSHRTWHVKPVAYPDPHG